MGATYSQVKIFTQASPEYVAEVTNKWAKDNEIDITGVSLTTVQTYVEGIPGGIYYSVIVTYKERKP